MSFHQDLNNYLDEHTGSTNALGHFGAYVQRRDQISLQRGQLEVLHQQTKALEKQNRIEQDRARIEQQRLDIERQRLAAEEAERELRVQQSNQIKELRNLITEASFSLKSFQKRYLS